MKFNLPYKHIYFIGIGGVSMSGLAFMLIKDGVKVAGSDANVSENTKRLSSSQVPVYIGHSKQNIKDDYDLVVYTAAIAEDNDELVEARNKNIPTMERSAFLGIITRHFKHTISVTGTHGKTTATGMLSQIFIKSEMSPTVSIGGQLPLINNNYYIGNSDYFILESCEYKNSFLEFNPHTAIVLNIDFDHADFFSSINDVRNSFKLFISKLPNDGNLIINSEIENIDEIKKHTQCSIITYGKAPAQWTAENISYNDSGCGSFDAFYNGKFYTHLNLNVAGEHNVYNALAACACAHCFGADETNITSALESFTGTKRRYEYKGSFNGISIIDDYAHHPAEIRATLSNATTAKRAGKYKNIVCVFQPHTFTRTKLFLDDFAEALTACDKLVVPDIYSAREKDIHQVHSKQLVEKVNELGGNAIYIGSFSEIEDYLCRNCNSGDLILTVGAGNINAVGESLLSR